MHVNSGYGSGYGGGWTNVGSMDSIPRLSSVGEKSTKKKMTKVENKFETIEKNMKKEKVTKVENKFNLEFLSRFES